MSILCCILLGCVWGSDGEWCIRVCPCRVCNSIMVFLMIHDAFSVVATIPRVQMLGHLWSLIDQHEHWDDKMGVLEASAKQLDDLCNGSLSKYLSSCGPFGWKLSSVCPHLIISVVYLTLLLAMPVLGMSMEAFESGFMAIVRETLGERCDAQLVSIPNILLFPWLFSRTSL